MKLSIVKFLKEMKMIDNGFDEKEALQLSKKLGLDFSKEKFKLSDWIDGINHEIEHSETVHDSPGTIAKIALDHLKEDPDYYTKLKKVEA